MPISIVVGGQFGSEGKGKVAHWLAARRDARLAIRVGGPNSGHTVVAQDGQRRVLRQLPTPLLHRGIAGVIASGAYLDLPTLLEEIADVGATPDRLRIDGFAVIVEDEHKRLEAESLVRRIASTGSGTGEALSNRVRRVEELRFARDVPALAPFLADTVEETRAALQRGDRIVIEGTQGFGLSLLHGRSYPYSTSRDTTAAGALSEAGLSPLDVDEVVLVLRAHPIRVGGNSGPLPNETTWEDLSRRLGPDVELVERTSVTGKVRRVADFDSSVVRRAIAANAPTSIVLNHLDYVPAGADNHERRCYVDAVERSIRHDVMYVGLGPAVIRERNSLRAAG
jgi:adenylosuccinate synthase